MESLCCLMVRGIRGGYVFCFFVGTVEGNSLMVSHLLFANDTSIFCNADLVQIEYLRHVFTWFEIVPNSTTIWNPVLEKMERRLAGWKRMYLSKGGKLTLIKSTLSNLPTYFRSLFHLPLRVAHLLEKLERYFLWSGISDQQKFHLVNCVKICEPIQSGGLGVKNLRRFNQALLNKWLWRYGLERETFWRQVVEVKHGSL